jgi:hypothetical protein
VTVQITNLKTGESYTGRLPITGNQQIYLPVEIQTMLKDSQKIRIQILGGQYKTWNYYYFRFFRLKNVTAGFPFEKQ